MVGTLHHARDIPVGQRYVGTQPRLGTAANLSAAAMSPGLARGSGQGFGAPRFSVDQGHA